jgi:hypothetical protein
VNRAVTDLLQVKVVGVEISYNGAADGHDVFHFALVAECLLVAVHPTTLGCYFPGIGSMICPITRFRYAISSILSLKPALPIR